MRKIAVLLCCIFFLTSCGLYDRVERQEKELARLENHVSRLYEDTSRDARLKRLRKRHLALKMEMRLWPYLQQTYIGKCVNLTLRLSSREGTVLRYKGYALFLVNPTWDYQFIVKGLEITHDLSTEEIDIEWTWGRARNTIPENMH